MSRHVGIGAESTYGTPVAPTEFLEALSESFTLERSFEDIITIRSNSVLQVNELTSVVRGEMTSAGNFEELGLLLKQFIGDVDTSGAGPYTHTFPGSTGTSGRDGLSLTVEVRRDTDTRTWRYAGCKVTGWSMSVSQDQSPQHTFTFVGKSEATGTAATASFPTFNPMLVADATVSFDGTSLPAKSVNLTCSWPVDEPFKIGSGAFAAEPIDNGPLSVEGEVTVIMTDTEMTQYNKYDGSTDVDVAIAVDDGTQSITLNMNKTRLVSATTPLDGRNRLEGTFTFKSYFDTTATENIQIVLVNNDATIP